MDYVLVQKVDGRITPRRLTPEEAEAWYHNQKDSDDPTTILDIRESTMFGSPVLEELDMLLIVAPSEVTKRLRVRVQQLVERLSNSDDRDEKPAGDDGRGSVRYYDVSEDCQTTEAALDEFHRTVPIGNLEEFRISAVSGGPGG